MNTVVANEAIVHHYAAQGLKIYGCNPGMLCTDIRTNHGMPSCIECCVSCCFCPPPVPVYGEKMLSVLASKEVAKPGSIISQDCAFIKPMPIFAADDQLATKLVADLIALANRGPKVQGNPLVVAPTLVVAHAASGPTA
jgi:hypothetical protein